MTAAAILTRSLLPILVGAGLVAAVIGLDWVKGKFMAWVHRKANPET